MKRAVMFCLAAAAFVITLMLKNRDFQPRSPMTGRAMGTSWTLEWRGDAPSNVHHEVAGVLEHWEQVMSQWRKDSDLSRFNRGEPASADLQRVMELAEKMKSSSGGAFDHHILAKVHAAGYGPPGNGIDLSAIGKGFAIDRVGEFLRQIGVRDFVFELGGEVIAGEGDWSVIIERPLPNSLDAARTVILRGRALATSGNYHQPGHIIDPRTGLPVNRPASSVSVLAADCATADAWATALFVLGPDFHDTPPEIEVTWQ
jgi:thiamine biosynthesis lipoprotein